MNNERSLWLLSTIKSSGDIDSDLGPLRSMVLPRLSWQPERLEGLLGVALPPDLRSIWDKTPGLVMFWDVTYGQSGLVLWSPDHTMIRHPRYYEQRRMEDWRPGDLIVGQFIGESDLLIVRCDPGSQDFGSVLIALPIDPREDRPIAAPTLEDFLESYWNTHGSVFWKLVNE